MKAGLALNPGTPLALLEEVVDDVDLVLVMSVNPGFGGQGYLPSATGKIRRVRELLDRHGSKAVLEVDGGINVADIALAAAKLDRLLRNERRGLIRSAEVARDHRDGLIGSRFVRPLDWLHAHDVNPAIVRLVVHDDAKTEDRVIGDEGEPTGKQ